LFGVSNSVKCDSIGKELPNVFERIVSPDIKKEIKACWHKIHAALQLHGLGITRGLENRTHA
jgi:hypothetical protein